jgi:hypothetical protein
MKDIDNGTSRVVDELFIALQAIFPAFKQAWPTQSELDEAKYHWTCAFLDSGLNDLSKIALGIKKCRMLNMAFVPNCGQFIAMCERNSDDLGLPSIHSAYKEACENSHPSAKDKKWTHAVVHHAWKECGSYNLSNWSQYQSRPLFERNYEIACRMFAEGMPLHKIDLALPVAEQVIIKTKKTAADHLSCLRSILSK